MEWAPDQRRIRPEFPLFWRTVRQRGAYLGRYVTEEQRQPPAHFNRNLRAARFLPGCFVSSVKDLTGYSLSSLFVQPAKIRNSAIWALAVQWPTIHAIFVFTGVTRHYFPFPDCGRKAAPAYIFIVDINFITFCN